MCAPFRHTTAFLALFLTALFAFAAPPPATAAIPLNSSIVAEQALVILDDTFTEIVIEMTVAGHAAPITLLLPLPADAEITQVGDNALFADLDAATQPEEQIEELLVWRASELTPTVAPTAPAPQVELQVAPSLDALRRSLGVGAAELPETVADHYAAGLQIALITAAQPGVIAPVRFRTNVDPARFIGALWPTGTAHELRLYILAAHRVDVAGMQAEFAGTIDTLGLRGIGTDSGARYITRLARPAGAGADTLPVTIIRAAADTPLRAVVTRTIYIDGWQRMAAPIAALVIVAVSSIGALSLALALRKRIDAIGEPPRGADPPPRR